MSTLQRSAAFLLLVSLILGGCASNGQQQGGDLTVDESVVEVDDTNLAKQNNPDPWEGFNRAIFSFNYRLDSWILKPVAKGYDYITPDPVQTGVGNFFSNIGEVGNIANDILQWKWKQAANDTGRLLTNSTLGLFGIFDVAEKFGMKPNDGEDTGQTFARWGVKKGPYLVLPFLGATTVRDAFGLPVDMLVLDPVNYVDPATSRFALGGSRLIHNRAELLDVEDLASGDLYLFIREAYLQRRDYLERDGNLEQGFEDEFGGDEDW